MVNPRWLAVLTALVIALAPALAEARAGAGSSAGSRGSRTYEAPPPTRTAPAPTPVERSITPQQQQRPAVAPSAPAQPGGFFSRNPFLSGIFGGMLGAGIFGMLFGGGFSGAGLGSMSGMLGLMLQALLIGGLLYLAFSFFRRKTMAAAESAHPGYGFSGISPETSTASSSIPEFGAAVVGVNSASNRAYSPSNETSISAKDYKDFEALLTDIQAAYSEGDIHKIRGLATPEMVGYFSEQLSVNSSRGVENKITAVKLDQGDLSEAWSEASIDYATVAMRFSMIDITKSIADGRIVEGSDQARVEATELWTFLRGDGGKWILSAIQQA